MNIWLVISEETTLVCVMAGLLSTELNPSHVPMTLYNLKNI